MRSEPLAPIGGDGIARDEILYLPIGSIDPDPEQPRLDVDGELADSIKQHGVLQPIQVRPHPGDADRWMIVDGERRYRGSLRAKLATIPATITLEVEDAGDRIIRQLVRNEGKPLTPVEEALAFKKIIDAKRAAGDKGGTKYGVVQLARDLGLAKSTISDRLTLTEIPAFWLALIVDGPLQLSHAPILHRWRKVPAKYQARALEQMKNDYRWPSNSANGYKKAKAGDRLYVGDFQTLVRTFMTKFVKPVGDCPGYTGPTERFALNSYEGQKTFAMDPSQWQPIYRQGLAAKKAKAGKKAARSRDSIYDWRAQQEKQEAEWQRQRDEWQAGLAAVLADAAIGIRRASDETLGEILLDCLVDDDGPVAQARELFPPETSPLRFLAFAYLVEEVSDQWRGRQAWAQLSKALGIQAASKKPKKAKPRPDPSASETHVPIEPALEEAPIS